MVVVNPLRVVTEGTTLLMWSARVLVACATRPASATAGGVGVDTEVF